ncbi:MAG: SIS domain-containing protein [Burkholderiales bacterium]|nr:SIS domain-containing protein [Burkholderiales bacterium]
MLEQRIQQQFFDSADLKYQSAESLSRPIAEAAAALLGAITGGGKVMVCGCGQAGALAHHMAVLLVDRFERERPPLAALALDAEPAPAKQLQALGHPGDALLLLDAGAGGLAREAVTAAHDKEMTVVAIGGASAGDLASVLAETDVMIAVPHERVARVLEIQLLALHCLCDAIDIQLLGEQEP